MSARRGTGPRRRGRLLALPLVLAVASGAIVLGSAPAHATGNNPAKLIDLHAAAVVGGMIGRGSRSTTPDFFEQSQGPGFGVDVGLRLLVVDLSIRFLQMVGSNGREGTLSSVMLGPSVEIPVKGGRHGGVLIRPGLAVGFGFGTPAPVSPPLNNEQISDKGLMVVGRFAVERMIGPVFGIGAEVQGGYHYFFGASGVVNDQQTHSEGWQVAGFGTVAVHFGI